MTEPSIIWIGPAAGPVHHEVVSKTKRNGLAVLDLDSPESLNAVLRLFPKAVIVVCDNQHGRISRQVLDSMAAGMRNAPVVVLVERSDFGDYYDVMAQGAFCYYEQSESPKAIANAVWWTASTRAA